MQQYTTGNMAKECNISVRTVQFYDSINLLNPSNLSEGGRRMYTEIDLKKLRIICLLKSLGLTLDSIKGILDSKNQIEILSLLLDQQLKIIDIDLLEKQKQKETIEMIKMTLNSSDTLSVDNIASIEKIMTGNIKLKKTHGIMLTLGIVMDLIQIGTILLWIFTGVWWPFVVGMVIVIIMGILMSRQYYRDTAYICPECNKVFKPLFRDLLNAKHTPKTRQLKCPHCGYDGYCVETFDEKEIKEKE